MRVIVIGAGISGLACAFRLAERGLDVSVVEESDRVGGVIASEARNGFLFELGPQSFQLTPGLAELIRGAGIEDRLISAPARAARYVFAGGRLHPVPMGPQILIGGSLLGFGTRVRFLRDLVGRSKPPEREETLAEFVERKFGPELLDRLAGPFVSGIYAGDPARLGLRDAFPDLHRWELEQGSILRGALRAMRSARRSGRARPTLSAIRGGNAGLMESLAAKLSGRVSLGTSVESVSRADKENGKGFALRVRGAAGTETRMADRVVMATPAGAAARMVAGLSARLGDLLQRMEYAPVAVVGTGYRREQVQNRLEGFGFLVARSERLKLLGTVWMSSLFAGRAGSGFVNLASFAGGAADPATAELAPDEIGDVVEKEMTPILGITGRPVERVVNVYRRALPQYNVGHERLVAGIRAEAERVPGLFLIGNYLDGISTGSCVDLAFRTAAIVAGQPAA
ncbi:MAG TPA: protoporphyrinogen oxidase [Candidatus Dormibacteraeota bacterium]|nr:protoporphyrinogen oxidase [Candidatus Dormibacteraeota bacterium]